MMTGRRACDEVTFGVDPSECLTASGYSELPQARLYPSSARTPPRLASRRPSSPQGPLAVPSCSGSGRDAPLRLRRSLLHPAAQRPPPSPPQRQQRSRSDRPVAADGEKREPGTGTGMGSVSRWHRRLPGRTSHSTPAPPPSSSRRKSTALSREGVQPTEGQALPATGSPRVPAAAHLAPAGAGGRGPGWSPRPQAIPRLCSEGLAPPVAGVSGAWRGLRAQFPGAERGATAAGGGFLRCCPSCSPPSSLSPPGLSALVAFGAP